MKKIDASERGQALIVIALTAVVLVAFAGLTIDGSRALSDRRQAQNAADASALAAALAKVSGQDYTTAAQQRATSNGYNGEIASDVVVNNPPISGPYAANSEYIQVIITSYVPTTFARILGLIQLTNRVEAVSHATVATSGSLFNGAAIVALAKTGCGMDFTSSVIKVTGGGLFVNSSAASGSGALCSNWAPNISTTGGCIDVVGAPGSNFTNGSQTITGPGFCNPKPSQINAPDFASMVPDPPTPPTCASPGTANVNTTTGIGTYTPGSFTSITVPFASGTFASGVYCLSGTLTVTGGASVTGGNVVFVFTGLSNGSSIGGQSSSTYSSLQIYTQNGSWSENGSTTLNVPGVFRFYSTGTGNYHVAGGSTHTYANGFFYLTGGVMDWAGSTNLNLTGPTSGPYKGVAIYSPITNTQTMVIYGGSNVNVTGSILHPGGTIQMNGSSNATGMKSQIVGNTITTAGGSTLTINYDPNLNIGSPTSASIELAQ